MNAFNKLTVSFHSGSHRVSSRREKRSRKFKARSDSSNQDAGIRSEARKVEFWLKLTIERFHNISAIVVLERFFVEFVFVFNFCVFAISYFVTNCRIFLIFYEKIIFRAKLHKYKFGSEFKTETKAVDSGRRPRHSACCSCSLFGILVGNFSIFAAFAY